MTSLSRFVDAQDNGVYETALAEIEAGTKRSHWMWFIFPQIAGLGRSEMAVFYAIEDRAEAEAYLDHPLLGPRLAASTGAMLTWTGKRTAIDILGAIDATKFRSSMTLFDAVASGTNRFSVALHAFCQSLRDPATLERL